MMFYSLDNRKKHKKCGSVKAPAFILVIFVLPNLHKS